MGTGKAIRRRAKLMKVANQGNLHKAARGRASAHMPLPPAPTQDDYKEKVPASLSRMMALKAAAAGPAKPPKVEASQQHASRPQGGQQFQMNQQQQQGKQQQETQQQGQHLEHREAPNQPIAAHGKATGKGAAASGKTTKAPAGDSSRQPGGPIWEQPKKLKQRKKEYLNAKKLKKKGRKGGGDEDHMVDKPAFGEVVHQPPKVHLKRKHWDPASREQLAGSRAQQQLQQQHQQHQRQKKQRQQQQVKPAKAQQDDPAMKELREVVIEGYRAARGPRVGHATLDSLKKLAQ